VEKDNEKYNLDMATADYKSIPSNQNNLDQSLLKNNG